MAKATVRFDKGTITLRSGKTKVSFHRIPDPLCMTDKGVKNDIEPIAPTMTINRLVLEWEKKIKLHLEKEMKINQWRSKSFKGKNPTLMATKEKSRSYDENPPPPPPPQTPTQQAPHTVSTIKLHIMKKEGLHKGYDRFSSLLSQLEIHGAGVSTEDANQKFLSTSSTNDVSTAYGVSTSSGYNSQRENSSLYTDELMYSFFANQSSGPQLDHEDLEQLDEFDLEEMDLKWQVAMISMRLKKFYKKTGHFARECRSKGNQESRRRDAGNTGYRAKDNGRRPGKQEEPKALVTLDGEGVDWTGHAEDEQENFALMAYSNSGSDTEVTSCSKECVESYAKLKKLYDEQREQLGDASIEIQAYTQALKKVEAQLVAHQKNQLWYEEKIRFMKIDLDDKTDVLTYHKKLLAEAVKEKEELKTKLENFQSSSKGLYRSSDVEDSPVHDRFANVEGMHAVSPPMTGNYMPSRPDREVDDSMFTYSPKQSKTSESDTQTSNFDSCKSNSNVKTLEYVPEPVVVEPKVPSKEQEKPSFAFVNTVKHVKTPRETVKEQNTYSPSPKADKRDWNGLMSKRLGLGYGFTKKACFVCGSFSHLIRDCDIHEKRIAKQVELNKQKVNTAKQNLSSQAATTSTARKVNTARPIVNEIRPRNNFYKSYSPIRRLFNRTTAPKAKFSNQKVNTTKVKAVSAVGGKRETTVKPSAGQNLVLPDLVGDAQKCLTVFWNTASSQTVNDEKQIHATIDSKAVVVTEASIRSSLLLNDVVGNNPKKKFLMYPRFLMVFLSNQIELGEPFNDVYITPAHTLKVFSNMSRKGVKFSGKVTPLFDSMLVPHQPPEGEGGPPSNRAKGGMTLKELSILYTNLSNRVLALEASKDAQAAEIIKLKARIKKLKKKTHLIISHHKAWLKSMSGLSMKRKLGRKESVSKQGRKNAKSGPTLDNSTFDDLDADHGMDYMDAGEPVNDGRLSKETEELNVTHDTDVLEKGGNNEEPVSAASNTGVSTAIPEVSTATPMTPPTITSVFEDEDIFLADALEMLSDKTKLKGVAIKEVKEFDKPERSILTLKPLSSIDPKDKGKGVLKESPVKKVKRTKMDASEELAARLQMEEREMYTVEERSRYKHAQLNKKTLEEIQALYINEQERAPDFLPIRSEKDERMIEKMNKKVSGEDEEEVLEEPDITKVKVKQEGNTESTRKRLGRRLKMKATKKSKRESKFYHNDRYGKPHDYYRVFRADGSSRHIKNFIEMVSRFDRLDFIELHSLVMKRIETSTPEEIDLILWGSLRTMFEANAEDDLWKNQEEWILKTWNFYDNCGVHILVLEDGTVFYMLAERRYPLTKETLESMLALRLIVESESEVVFDLLRFNQKQINESESHDKSGKDL
ncbi:hypothetical protein Tco_1383714 [Tanacetum coccineum]